MKRLALLLAAMGIISATALAEQPTLKVTSFGQEIELDNTSGGVDVSDCAQLYNILGLQYGDWEFTVTGGKFWTIDTEDGIHSDNGRVQFDVWKPVTENLRLGGRYRGQNDFDRYQVGYSYTNGMFWTSGDFWYQANNKDAADNFEMEWYPLGLQYGVFKAGWFVNYWNAVGTTSNTDKEEVAEHQVRLFANLYKNEKLSVDTEVRITISDDKEFKGNNKDLTLDPKYTEFDDFGRYRVYLGASYALTENLDIYGKYGYELGEKDYLSNGKECNSDKYYGEFVAGWKYKF